MMEKWLAKELELNQRHEEIVMRREALLNGTETYYDVQDRRVASFIADFSKAKERNEKLLQDIRESQENMRREVEDPGTPKFKNLKNNYWTMVKNVFPVWQDDMREYQRRHRSPGYSPASPRARSTTPHSNQSHESPHSHGETTQDSPGPPDRAMSPSTFSVSGTKLSDVIPPPLEFQGDFSGRDDSRKSNPNQTVLTVTSDERNESNKTRRKLSAERKSRSRSKKVHMAKKAKTIYQV